MTYQRKGVDSKVLPQVQVKLNRRREEKESRSRKYIADDHRNLKTWDEIRKRCFYSRITGTDSSQLHGSSQ
jgi:hypothetical protein